MILAKKVPLCYFDPNYQFEIQKSTEVSEDIGSFQKLRLFRFQTTQPDFWNPEFPKVSNFIEWQ